MRRKIYDEDCRDIFVKMTTNHLTGAEMAREYNVTQSTISRALKFYSMSAYADFIRTVGDYAWCLDQKKYKMPIETFNLLLEKGRQHLEGVDNELIGR